jgi:hypothetical protein
MFGVAIAHITSPATIHGTHPLCAPRPRVEHRTTVAPGSNKQKTAANVTLLPTVWGKLTKPQVIREVVF